MSETVKYGVQEERGKLWKGIADYCQKKYGIERTTKALRSTWRLISRE